MKYFYNYNNKLHYIRKTTCIAGGLFAVLVIVGGGYVAGLGMYKSLGTDAAFPAPGLRSAPAATPPLLSFRRFGPLLPPELAEVGLLLALLAFA